MGLWVLALQEGFGAWGVGLGLAMEGFQALGLGFGVWNSSNSGRFV